MFILFSVFEYRVEPDPRVKPNTALLSKKKSTIMYSRKMNDVRFEIPQEKCGQISSIVCFPPQRVSNFVNKFRFLLDQHTQIKKEDTNARLIDGVMR